MNIKKILLVSFFVVTTTLLLASEFGKDITASMQKYGIPKPLIVILISMLPIVELRGAIPIAIGLLGMDWWEAAMYAILGNMIPIPFILLLMGWFTDLLGKWSVTDKFLKWLFARTRRKGKLIERYEEVGLTLFIAVPLPITGAWTGSLAAHIFGLKFWKSLACAFAGVLIASVIVTLLTVGIDAIV